MAKKKKQQEYYCRICGEYKANEKFSGKGHARHICKECQSLPDDVEATWCAATRWNEPLSNTR